MKLHRQLPFTVFLFQLAACHQTPCADCENEDIAEEDGTGPDLPCGGTDLKSDDRNCGDCGNACNVVWPGTKYAAGGCVDGECGPKWSTDFPLPEPPEARTCDQMCALGNVPCVPRGCSGMTAYVCETVGDFGDQCDLGDPAHEAIVEFAGECDQPIPYPDWFEPEGFSFINFGCCCEF